MITRLVQLLLHLQLTASLQIGNSSMMCLTHSPAMEGVCKPARSCRSYQGFCENSGNVCCVDVYKCGGVTREKVSYFQNEEYPGPVQTGVLCSHILRVADGVCFVRLDLHSFSLGGQDCGTDWLSVIGAGGGREAVPAICGDRRGQAMMIPVQERQNLILAVGVQTLGTSYWNIQATMIECGHVSLHWRDSVRSCPADQTSAVTRTQEELQQGLQTDEKTRHTITVVNDGEEEGTREYNTSSGAMILVSNNDNQFYTWVEEREPRKIRGKVNVKTNTRNNESRKRKKRQREKNKKGQSSQAPRLSNSPIHPVVDTKMPVVKIMLANQVVCSGVAIHPMYVLTSANCVTNMTGLYILQARSLISLYQVYLYSQHGSSPVAVIQTLTRLSSTHICFQGLGLSREMLVGYMRNSKRKDAMVYTRANVNTIKNQSRTIIQNVDLDKWVEGSVLLKPVGTSGYSVTGIISNPRTLNCQKKQYEVTIVTEEILGWISALITQNTPIIPVS